MASATIDQIRARLAALEEAGANDAAARGAVSFSQHRLWFLEQLTPGTGFYNICAGVRIRGELQVPALHNALRDVVERHPALRTAIVTRDGEPVPTVCGDVSIDVPLTDLSAINGRRQDAAAALIAAGELRRPIATGRAPLLRARLVRCAASSHVLILTLHHIAADAWSVDIVLRDLLRAYEARVQGRPPELRLAGDFQQWASAQRRRFERGEMDASRQYWMAHHASPAEPLSWPVESQPAGRSLAGRSELLEIEAPVAAAFLGLCAEERCTPFCVWLAAYAALLYRYTGAADIPVGMPISNRDRVDLDGTVGFFANTIALRIDVEGDMTFRALLRRVRDLFLEAAAHREYPFEKLVEELHPDRRAPHPLFQVMFRYDTAVEDAWSGAGLSIAPYRVPAQWAKFDLNLLIVRTAAGFAGTLEYDASLFRREEIGRLRSSFAALLSQLASDPDRFLGGSSLVHGHEQALLEEWGAGPGTFRAGTLHEDVERHAHAFPGAIAIRDEDGVEISYGALNAFANALARRLLNRGLAPEGAIGVYMPRSARLWIAVLAISKAGAVCVPLDPAHPVDRLERMAMDAGCRLLLTDAELAPHSPSGPWGMLPYTGEVSDPADAADLGLPVASGQIAYIVYTSGSTGKPKGIALPHDVLRNLMEWHARAQPHRARVLQFASLGFDASFHEALAAWNYGGTLFVCSEETRRDVWALSRFLTRNRVDKAIFPVVVMHELAEIAQAEALEFPHLREIITTGEQLRITAAMTAFFTRQRIELYNHYGPAETHVVTACRIEGNPADWPTHPSIGRPITGARVYILDRDLQPALPGSIGELYLGGPVLARGYTGKPAQTAARFVPDPFSREAGARMYRTGDRARFQADGSIAYLGRADHQLKIRGVRVEPGEVESVLLRHPAVQQAHVMGYATSGGTELLAVIATGQDGAALDAALRLFAAGLLPAQMVPAKFLFVDQLPLTQNGKVDQRALGERAQTAAAGPSLAAGATPLEEIVSAVWREALDRPVQRSDNFFEAGGHSLLATRIVARLRASVCPDLPVAALFEHPTPTALAAHIQTRAGSPDAPPALKRGERTEAIPLSFAQQGMWLAEQFSPAPGLYNCPVLIRLDGPVDIALLGEAWRRVTARHEILRSEIYFDGGEPRQRIHSHPAAALAIVDLGSVPPSSARETLLRAARQFAGRPFLLSAAPLYRLAVFRLGRDSHVLALVLHHIVFDGWSAGVLLEEVTQQYRAVAGLGVQATPDLPVQYADYAIWQRLPRHQERRARLAAYWREQLRGCPFQLDLTGCAPTGPGSQGSTLHFQWTAGLTAAVEKLAQRSAATPYMTLLATLAIVLRQRSRENDFVIGTDFANRPTPELERLIGLFVNQILLRVQIRESATFADLLDHVRRVCLDAFTHQDLPFDDVLQGIRHTRMFAEDAPFGVKFVLQNAVEPLLKIDGLSVSFESLSRTESKYGLLIDVCVQGGRLHGAAIYRTALYDSSFISGLLDDFRFTAETVSADPAQPVASLVELLDARAAARVHALLPASFHGVRRKPVS
jgi:amino acid adenylation domain-containing protein